jgi:hypothetical protein
MKTLRSGASTTLKASVSNELRARKGAFANGYDSDKASRVLGDVKKASGLDVVILWERFDDSGFGGDSTFAVLHQSRLYEILSGSNGLSDFLWGRGPCPKVVEFSLGREIPFRTCSDSNFSRC